MPRQPSLVPSNSPHVVGDAVVRVQTVSDNGTITDLGTIGIGATPKSATATNGTAAVATSSTAIVAANTARKEVTLVNISDTDVQIALGATATATIGVRLDADGGSYTTQVFTGAINGIHAGAGTKTVTYSETA